MAVKQTVNNLKERPKDEREVIAGGVAATVVVILLVAWGIYFFHQIGTGAVDTSLDGGSRDAFVPSDVRTAGEQLQQFYGERGRTNELLNLRDSVAQQQANDRKEIIVPTQQSGQTDLFGNSNSGN